MTIIRSNVSLKLFWSTNLFRAFLNKNRSCAEYLIIMVVTSPQAQNIIFPALKRCFLHIATRWPNKLSALFRERLKLQLWGKNYYEEMPGNYLEICMSNARGRN